MVGFDYRDMPTRVKDNTPEDVSHHGAVVDYGYQMAPFITTSPTAKYRES
jgi:hypothetical protein